MARPLAPLRPELDGFPSDDPARPALILRDTSGISEAMLSIPAPLVSILRFFDGEHTEEELTAAIRAAGEQLDAEELTRRLVQTLSEAGMLADEKFEAMRDGVLRSFRIAKSLEAKHHGPGNYPSDGLKLRQLFGSWFGDAPVPSGRVPLHAVAAPHASPGAAKVSYAKAYGALANSLSPQEASEKTFMILGTSHYGAPDRFGLTRKRFVTPLGETRTNQSLIERLQHKAGVELEDFSFSTEHSVEFQVVFLQYLYGPDIQIVPILCGSFGRSLMHGGPPESHAENQAFLSELGELSSREGDRLVWVLGVDMAHKGPRYGRGETPRRAYSDAMADVTAKDNSRIAALARGDRSEFWAQVQEGRDELNWCGSAPFYTYLAAHPNTRGELLSYEHWQIDPKSVVTFAGMSFTRSGG